MERREQPFFSIIITAYNRAALLKRALNSLVTQTETDWEAIIIDDGSTDNTEIIALHFSANYRQISSIYQDNQGAGFSKNFGVSWATGKYITFLDSDDEYKPEHLSLLKRFLIENPEIEFIHGTAKIIGNQFVPDFNNPGQIIHLDNCNIGGTFVFKKAIPEQTGGYPVLRFGDDVTFYDLVLKLNLKIAKVDFKTYIYNRDNNDSVCNIILNKERFDGK